jgi:nitrate reductase cytochrome c-type subunit
MNSKQKQQAQAAAATLAALAVNGAVLAQAADYAAADWQQPQPQEQAK